MSSPIARAPQRASERAPAAANGRSTAAAEGAYQARRLRFAAEAARLGANARRRVAERFLPDRQLVQYAELLERLLTGDPA